MNELKRRYARLRAEIETLSGAGVHSEVRLARLIRELDQIDDELAIVKRRALTAPTLHDAVACVESSAWQRLQREHRPSIH